MRLPDGRRLYTASCCSHAVFGRNDPSFKTYPTLFICFCWKLIYILACVAGHVLIIDEADKAPTHVTSTLRSLLESKHIRLPDGRVISEGPDADIKLHPDFRIIALANRPGFPFLGNDFFGACGDSFSSFAIDNPTLESEKQMLIKYAPGKYIDIIIILLIYHIQISMMAFWID